MTLSKDIVITGVGVVSPIGVTPDTYWNALVEGRSGIVPLTKLDVKEPERPICGEVADCAAKQYVKPRKNIKVMSADIQLGFVAACKACESAGVESGTDSLDPERFGVLYGADLIGVELPELVPAYRKCIDDGKMHYERWGREALDNIFPLWMLKYLPNMPACHIGIGHDARGPNDSVTLDRVSGLAALSEACRVIERGQADIMIAGATSSRLDANLWARQKSFDLSDRKDPPGEVLRPFDAERSGSLHGEGAAAFILETAEHAAARGAKPIARILGFAHRFKWHDFGHPVAVECIEATIRAALDDAELAPGDIGHVNAEGLSTIADDRAEAEAIHRVLNATPVTAPKAHFGNLSAATGAVEAVASLLALERDLVPPTLNYKTPDPECPVNVVHGEPLSGCQPTALLLNHCRTGRSSAMVIAKA